MRAAYTVIFYLLIFIYFYNKTLMSDTVFHHNHNHNHNYNHNHNHNYSQYHYQYHYQYQYSQCSAVPTLLSEYRFAACLLVVAAGALP